MKGTTKWKHNFLYPAATAVLLLCLAGTPARAAETTADPVQTTDAAVQAGPSAEEVSDDVMRPPENEDPAPDAEDSADHEEAVKGTGTDTGNGIAEGQAPSGPENHSADNAGTKEAVLTGEDQDPVPSENTVDQEAEEPRADEEASYNKEETSEGPSPDAAAENETAGEGGQTEKTEGPSVDSGISKDTDVKEDAVMTDNTNEAEGISETEGEAKAGDGTVTDTDGNPAVSGDPAVTDNISTDTADTSINSVLTDNSSVPAVVAAEQVTEMEHDAKLAASAVATTVNSIKQMVLKVIDYDGKGYGDGQILSSAGRNLLIDTYVKESWNPVNSWLKDHGYTAFDIYISHYHDDHMDNVTRLINDGGYRISKLYLPDYDYMTGSSSYMKNYISYYKNVINTAKNNNIPITFLKKGSSFTIGDVSAKVLWGTDYKNGNHNTNYINNNSLVTMFTCGDTRYLNAGDIEAPVEKQILDAKVDIKADILKLSHHGGDTSNTYAFIKAVDPSFCYYNYCGDSPSKYAPNGSWARNGALTAAKFANVSSVRYNGDITYRVYDNVITQELERNYTQQKVYLYDKKDKKKLKGVVTQQLNDSSPKYADSCAHGTYTCSKTKKSGTHADDGWILGNAGFQYYYKDNKPVTGWRKINGSLYHFDTKTAKKDTGWKKFGNYTFYFYGSGKMATGFAKIGSATYHFNENGRQTKRGWHTINGKKYCFGSGNKLMFGMHKVGGKTYIFNKTTGELRTGPVQCDGKKYFCDANGVVQSYGWRTYKGNRYYVNPKTGTMVTGPKKIDGKLYYFGSGGALIKKPGFIKLGGKVYYSRNDGSMKTGWLKVNGNLYYMGTDGVRRTGWVKCGKKRFYLDSKGIATKARGFTKIGRKTYYICQDGSVKTGWLKVNGKMYYMNADGSMHTGWLVKGNKKYYFSKTGVLR